jgi:hypothetical protein
MDALYREPTNVTPYIYLDPNSGLFFIEGRSIPENAEMFYSAVLTWLDQLVASPPASVQVSINLDFMNIASSKRLLFAMYKLYEAQAKGCRVTVKWYYDVNDKDMLEVGMDYSQMVEQIPFEYIALKSHKTIIPTLKVG